MVKPKTTNTNKEKQRKKKWRVYAISLSVIFVILLTYDVLIGGNIRYYSKLVDCGEAPLVGRHPYKNVPVYEKSSVSPDPFRLMPDYFCTPLEAEQAGYSATPDSYNFPNLKKTNQ